MTPYEKQPAAVAAATPIPRPGGPAGSSVPAPGSGLQPDRGCRTHRGPTTRGGHLAVYEAIRAQLDPPLGQVLRPFDRIRRRRHDVKYPPTDAPQMNPDDVREDVTKAAAIIDLSERVLDQMSPF